MPTIKEILTRSPDLRDLISDATGLLALVALLIGSLHLPILF